ncbi:MAG TPA: group II intron maturase-specific domain-containing protein [Steroidobacteraceae bacterium]|nr:group II intron maturase-specific domain-containing protein [Steroidobacteraceae bacterium]
MQRLRLTVNEEKTHICLVPVAYFEFLGYQFGRYYSKKTGKAYLGTRPSKRSVKRLIVSIHELTTHRRSLLEAEVLMTDLNRKLSGWANYFKLGPVSPAYRAVDRYTKTRLRRWLCHKHKVRNRGRHCFSDEYLYQRLGLVQLPVLTRNLPWAQA